MTGWHSPVSLHSLGLANRFAGAEENPHEFQCHGPDDGYREVPTGSRRCAELGLAVDDQTDGRIGQIRRREDGDAGASHPDDAPARDEPADATERDAESS